MANETTEARFPIDFEGNAVEFAEEGAASLEQLRDSIKAATESLRENNATLRTLRGTSDEVTAARDALKQKIDAERNAISASSLAILKQGTSYEKLIALQKEEQKALDDQRKAQEKSAEKFLAQQAAEDKALREHAKAVKQAAAEEQRAARLEEAKKQRKVLEEIKNTLAATKVKTEATKEAFAAAGGPLQGIIGQISTANSIIGGGAGFTFLVAGAAAAVVALTAAAVAGVVSLGRWAIAAANASRAMGILREAAAGSAENAGNLGTQVDALWRKVPTGREALNQLASDLTRTLSGTRVSGQGIVDTFNAVAQASSAMGDEVGSQLRGIIDRGKQFGRIGIGLNELQGTGLSLEDVAAPLAKGMKTSVEEARRALVYGMVPIDQGAKAIRDAVEKRFGGINAKKLLDINVIAEKFSDRLQRLASGFNLEPVLHALDELSSMFDESTVTGDALKQLITIFGTGLGAAFKDGTPTVKVFFEEMIIGAQRAMIWLLRASLFVKNNFLQYIEGDSVTEKFLNLGKSAVWGFINGMMGGVPDVAAATLKVGKAAWDTLRSFWDSHSPSRRAMKLGADIAEGKAQGIESKDDRVAQAAAGSGKGAATALGGGARASGGGGLSVTIGNLQIIVQGGGASAEDQGRAAAESFRTSLLELLEEVAQQEGIPTQAQVA